KVKNTYQKYSKIASSSGLTGKEVAEQILQDNGIYDVEVQPVKGTLTDHYDPKKKVVRLSANNYYGRSKAAVAVSAHEVGHAIQDAEEYAFLRFRSNLVPLASFGSSSAIWIIIAGMLFQMSGLLLVGIVFMAFAVLFQLVTLPVEFNASNRALDQSVIQGIIPTEDRKDVCSSDLAFLRFRFNLVPLASFGSRSAIWIIIAGMLFQMSGLLLVGIVFMAFAVLFQLVTLPVEFNASNRAMDQLVMTGIIPN